MAEEQKVEQAVENTNQEVSAEQIVEQQKKVEGAEIDDLREALKKSDWVAKLVGGQEKKEEKPKEEGSPAADGKQPEKSAENPKPAQDEQPAAEKPKAKAKPQKRVDEQPRQEIDVGAVAEAAAESAARTVAKMQAGKQEDEIPDHIKSEAAIYAELESIDPKKYSGMMRKRADFSKKEEERANTWERSHPGEVYDADADEHKTWYEANEPKIDPADYDDAKFNARLNKAIEEKVRPEIDKARAEVEKTRVEPLSAASAANVTEKVLGAFVPDAQLTRENVKKLIDDDPDAYEIAVQVDNAFRPIAAAVPKLYRGIEQFDEKNSAHVHARGMLTQMEKELAASDAEDLNRGGRQWVPLSKFYSIPAEKRGGYWCVSENDIANYVALTAQHEAKNAYEQHQKRLDEFAKRRGWVKPDAAKAKQEDQPQDQQKQEKPKQQQAQPKSPSVGAAPTVGAKTVSVDTVNNDPLSPLWTRMGLQA